MIGIGSHKLSGVESLRGLAALMILLFHVVELMKVPLPHGLGFVRSHFGLGVPLFFTLSGFVLAYGYADKLAAGDKIVIKEFYLRRFFRIAPLYYAMMLTWMVVGVLIWGSVPNSQTIFLNATFLFGLVPGEHEGIVWAGWSIGIEMLFYMLFPLFAMAISSIHRGVAGFLAACIVSSAVNRALAEHGLEFYAYMNLATQLPFFLAGMTCFRVWQRISTNDSRVLGLSLFGCALILALLCSSPGGAALLSDLHFGAAQRNAWAIVFTMLLLSNCLVSNPLIDNTVLRTWGKMSFSLYLTHPLIVVGLIKVDLLPAVDRLQLGVPMTFVTVAAIAISVVTIVSYCTNRFIESPGIQAGSFVVQRLRRNEASP